LSNFLVFAVDLFSLYFPNRAPLLIRLFQSDVIESQVADFPLRKYLESVCQRCGEDPHTQLAQIPLISAAKRKMEFMLQFIFTLPKP